MEEFKTFKNFKELSEENDPLEMPVELEAPAQETPAPSFSGGLNIPKSLDGEITSMLNERIGDEYKAYYFYKNAYNWCKNANYNKAASFFEKESAGELEHSKGLQDYLTQWNLIPSIPQVTTQHSFTSLVDIINKAYDLEYELLLKYSSDQQSLLGKHPATFNFIQKYVDIQNGEVEEYSDLLNALQLVNIDNKLDVMYFEKNYF